MQMKEPKIEFIPIDLSDIVTYPSACTDGATGCTDAAAKQDASIAVCDCTNGVNQSVIEECTVV